MSCKRFITPYPPTPVLENWRVLKMNNVGAYIGSPATVAARIAYAVANGFNWLQFYGLYGVFGDPVKESQLASMISACYAAGIIRVGAIMGAGVAGFNLAFNYNASVSPSEQFNDMNKENEAWRYPFDPAAESWVDWFNSVDYVRGYIDAGGFPWVMSAYIQDYVPSVWPAGVCAQMIASNINYLETTNYTTAPNELAVRNSLLNQLGSAAIVAHKQQKFNNLFSAESTFMGPYFGANGLNASFATWAAQFASDSFVGKNGLVYTGNNVFSYNDISAYIP